MGWTKRKLVWGLQTIRSSKPKNCTWDEREEVARELQIKTSFILRNSKKTYTRRIECQQCLRSKCPVSGLIVGGWIRKSCSNATDSTIQNDKHKSQDESVAAWAYNRDCSDIPEVS